MFEQQCQNISLHNPPVTHVFLLQAAISFQSKAIFNA